MTAAFRHVRQKPVPFKIEKTYSMTSFDTSDIKWVERFIVGMSDPDLPLTPDEIDWQLARVNRALRSGKFIGFEQNLITFSDGKRKIITQYSVYHIGFKHRPDGK